MSTRGKEYKQNRKYDKDGNLVPVSKVQKMYQKNYKFQRNKQKVEEMEFSVEMKYVLDSFWLLICGCLVMWMAAGFAMLEAGLVRTKNTTAILTKNITLYLSLIHI